ncbi:MAG TPA: TIGR00701 family protein [Saprospirales bacterium]|nr:TIGR00701 family protein [Saprospirales bacterium]
MQISDWYAIAKALHLIGMVSWMAGIFYLVRIMVYHAQSKEKAPEIRLVLQDQFTGMEWKAYKVIIQPAVVITWAAGSTMLFIQSAWLQQPWMHVKLTLLVLLTVYTHGLKDHVKKLEAGTSIRTHLFFRAWNEVPTIAMVGIIFLAVFKDRINFFTLFIGLILFVLLIGWGIWKVNRRSS